MSVYNIEGTQLNAIYSVLGASLSTAYDIDATIVFSNEPTPPTPTPEIEPMDWSNMSATYKANIDDAIEYADTYLSNHANAYSFPVLTDVHDQLYNEPNYVLYNHPGSFDKFLFLGDIATAYSQTQMDNATDYMSEADVINILDLVGNHELGDWASGDPLPKTWYETLIPFASVKMQNTDALVYYFDDTTNNVRFICLDSCTPIYQSSGTQLLTKNELEFFASALDSANGKDIILLNHAPGQNYYYVTDTEKETAISTTSITNRSTLDSIINAFIDRNSVTFTDDSNVSHTHDYSSATGDFIGLIAGHTHHAGYNNANGYNVFICPSSYYNTDAGMSVFVIDKTLKKVIFLIGYKNNADYGLYEYAY